MTNLVNGKSHDQSLTQKSMDNENNSDFIESEEALEEEIEQATEVVEEEESSDIEETPVIETEEIAPPKIKIGEQEYDQSELEEIVAKGSKIKEWESKMPGFNVDTFMPDYTRKSQRLAEMEKRLATKDSEVKPEELESLGIDETQIEAFKKIGKHLGYVNKADLVQDSVEAQKEAFIARHPEYQPTTLGFEAKWTRLMEDFALYDWKNHPDKVEHLLEKTHEEVSKVWQEAARGNKVQEIITTQKAKVDQNSLGGGGNGAPLKTAPKNTSDYASRYRAMGWTEEEINDILN